MKILHAAIMVIMLLSFAGSGAYAGETGSPPEAAAAKAKKEDERLPIHKQEQWQFFLAPYAWIPGADIQTTFSGHTTSVSVPWWDIVKQMFKGNAIGAMGRAEVWKGRWGFFLDSYFSYIGVSVSDSSGKTILLGRHPVLQVPVKAHLTGDVKAITRLASLDLGPRFLLGTVPLCADKTLPVLSFEALAGARINFFNQYLKLGVDGVFLGPDFFRTPGGTFVGRFDRVFAEPFLGTRLGLWLTPKTVLTFKGTVGGFTLVADNNLDYDLELSFGYRVCPSTYIYGGYRAHYTEFSQSKDPLNLSLSGWLHGPVLGAVFTF
jgi:hypothetical protein